MRISLATRILDLIAPRTCHVCGGRLAATEETLCTVCSMHLPRTDFQMSPLDNPMARMFWGRIRIERAAAFIYHTPHSETASMIYAMKYGNRPDTAVSMGTIAAREFAVTGFFEGIDVIVPVPLSRGRQRSRGYNQSEQLALGISEATGIAVETRAVRRIRFDGSQTNLSRWSRHDNVEGLFRLHRGDLLEGRHVLLVDDVVTSGATMTACAKEIERVAGTRISVMTLAIAHS